MKTKIKRHSRSVISVILAVCMLVSCMTVGMIATDAAKVQSESVGDATSRTIYLTHNIDDWYKNNYVIGVRYSSGTEGTVTWQSSVATDTGQTINGKHVYSAIINDINGGVGAMYIKAYANSTDANNDNSDKGNVITVYSGWTGYSNWEGKYFNGSSFVSKPPYDTYYVRNGTNGTKDANDNLVELSFNTSTKKYSASQTLNQGSTYNLYVYNSVTSDEWRIGAATWTETSSTTVYNYGAPGNQGAANITIAPSSTGTFSFEFVNKLGTIKEGSNYRADAGTFTITFPTTTQLTKPTIQFEDSGAVNAGNSATLQVTNHGSYPAGANVSYKLYKGGTEVEASKYSANGATITISSCTAADTGDYQVRAVTGNANVYSNSVLSDTAKLTVYEPQFSLLGNVASTDIAEIVNVSGSHDSTAPHKWPDTPVDDESYFKDSVRVNGPTGTPGKYQIKFKVINAKGADIGIYQKGTGQRAFSYGGTNYDTTYNDLAIPRGGISGIDLISGASSMVFKTGVVYTLTIDQTQTASGKYGVIDITSDSADIHAVARYKSFNPTTGQLNNSVANAPAAIGTATAAPSSGQTAFNSTLTATVGDANNYTFVGWYSNAECTASVSNNAVHPVTVPAGSGDVYYYALFEQNTPTPVDLNFEVTGGSVSVDSGTVPGISNKVYPGATVTFTVTPTSDTDELKTVTATNGSVSINGNKVTISNINAATTVTVTCGEVETYTLDLSAVTSTYGTFAASYKQKNGTDGTLAATSTDSSIEIKKGTTVTLTAAANTGANAGIFNGWKVVSGSYQRSKKTPLSAKILEIQPSSDMSIQALFAKGVTPSGSQVTTGTFIKVSDEKWKQYTTNAKLYKDNKTYKSYFEIGDTDDPANGKLKANKDYWFMVTNGSDTVDANWSHYQDEITLTLNPTDKTKWCVECKTEGQNADNKTYYFIYVKFKEAAKTAVVTWGSKSSGSDDGWFDKDSGKYPVSFVVTTGETENIDDSPSLTGMQNLYVLDGIESRVGSGNNMIPQDYATNKFGNTIIVSANNSVAQYNYYDAEGDEKFVKTDNIQGEGGTLYHYNPAADLDFRVQTTIKDELNAIGVRAYVMNGITYPAKKDKNGNYYAHITLDANSGQGTLEVIPVYYNTKIPEKDYIKFVVDANTIPDGQWGKTLGYSLWYSDATATNASHGFEGGYPGQPLMSDGNLLYGYIPKYYWPNTAASAPTDDQKSTTFAGLTLTNLAEHNYTHQTILKEWNVSEADAKQNFQTFDYEDPAKIAAMGDYDTIEFVAKYKSSNDNRQTGTHFVTNYSKDNGLISATTSNWPTGITKPTSASDLNGFELLTDIDGNPVDIYNTKLTNRENFSDAVYVVSVGNQIVSPNQWDTVWMVYSNDTTPEFITAKNPAEFIGVAAADKDNRLSGKTVYINYEYLLDGDAKSGISNSGDRIDGRWLYSSSKEPTTLRLRVATENGGTLTFEDNFLDWAEITDGNVNGPKESVASGVAATKLLNLPNRTTEVTAKINPVGYEVTGMYMLKSKYSSATDNGYSSALSDYDNLDVTGTATSFTNTRDNRMVIIVKEIPQTDLVITHQMYGGPGAHKIKGFYYIKAELLNADDTVKKSYGDYTNKPLKLEGFTTYAPKSGNYKLKIYIKTAMSGSATFNQWYENDPVTTYNQLPSDDKRGSTEPVEYEKIINVATDLYKDKNDYLTVKNLDYYSDLQSADSVNINHVLLPSTTGNGMTGATYNKVTVVDSTGNTLSGGDLSARARTTTVETNFITEDNAQHGCQLKIEIWTVPNSPASFDKFYTKDQAEMTTAAADGIYYSVGETITVSGVTYQKATVMVPISYFFKSDVDDQGNPVLVFDSAKKDLTLYSSLKVGMKYMIAYDFTTYRGLYGEVTKTTGNLKPIDAEDLQYFEQGSVKNLNGQDITTMRLIDNAAMKTFIDKYAPYEDGFMEDIVWKSDVVNSDSVNNIGKNSKTAEATGVMIRYNSDGSELTLVVKATQTPKTHVYATFYLPYDVVTEQFGQALKAQEASVSIDGQTQKVVHKKDPKQYGGRGSGAEGARTIFGTVLKPGGSFVTAPDKLYDNDGFHYFSYWEVKNVPSDTTEKQVVYTKCYSKEFNLALYQDSIITPIFNNTKPVSPHEEALGQNGSNNLATISFMENSRSQWNSATTNGKIPEVTVGDKKEVNPNWKQADRVYTDFLISFAYNDKQLNTDANTKKKIGIVLETVGDLTSMAGWNNETGAVFTQEQYATQFGNYNENEVKEFITNKNYTGNKFLKSEKAATTLDNKNRMDYYYALPLINQNAKNTATYGKPTGRETKVYRAYSYLLDENGAVALLSEPIYFTIYDIATINYQQSIATTQP